jgi:hypothetical protein
MKHLSLALVSIALVLAPKSLLAADPSAEKLIFTGAASPGTTSISLSGNTYTLSFFGDEVIQYQLNLSDPFNAGGTLRIKELTSDSYPMDGTGFVYKDPNGLFWFPKDNYKNTTLISQSVNGKTLSLDYLLNQNGTHAVHYDIKIEGKALRVRIYDPTLNTTAANNFSGIHYGGATGVETPKIIKMQGTQATPIVLFRKPTAQGNQHFFTASMLDMFQSGTSDYLLSSINNPIIGSDSITSSYTTATQYKPMSDGRLAAPLDDSYIVVVSGKVKDVLLSSTTPTSPYRNMLVNRMVFNGPEDVWSWYSGMFDLYLDNGMYNLAGYFFDWSAGQDDVPATINVGPDWLPAVNQTSFEALLKKGKAHGALVGAYSAFNCVPPNAPSAFNNPNEFVRDAAGNVKVYPQLGFPLLGIEASAPYATQEIGKLKNLGASAVYVDIQTYGNLSKAPDGDHMDQQASSPWAKTLKKGFAAQKKIFGDVRDQLEGPLMGEGSIATVNSNQEFLWYGYVDSVQRCINTAALTTASQIPAGSPLAPTNWPIIPEYEWRVAAQKQINHGLGFHDRFFGPTDGPGIVNMSTGHPIYPLTQEAMDLYQAFLISYGHSGYVTTNGTQQDHEGYITRPGSAQTYFMTNALQTMYFLTPVTLIRYLHNGEFKSFEQVLFETETTDSFRHIPLALQFANGLKIYVNHGSTPLNITEQGKTYTLPAKTGYWAGMPGFLTCFSAIAPGTNGNRIDYCNAAGQYEYFNGRGLVSGYGGITTASKRSKWVVHPTNLTVTEDSIGQLNHVYGAAPLLTSMIVVPTAKEMKPGERQGLRAVAVFSNGSVLDVTTMVDWLAAKKTVTKVNSSGVVEAVGNGSSKIYPILPSGLIGGPSVTLTVKP